MGRQGQGRSWTTVAAGVAGLVVWGAVAVPSPASAGGPTSVILTDHGHGRAAALTYSDPDYDRLEALLNGTGRSVPAPDPEQEEGVTVGIHWLIHDQDAWRNDTVHLPRPGSEPLVCRIDLMVVSATSCTWFAAADPGDLVDLLTRLGLIGPRATAASTTPPGAASVAAAPASSVPVTPAGLPSSLALGASLLVGVGLGAFSRSTRWLRDRSTGGEVSAQAPGERSAMARRRST